MKMKNVIVAVLFGVVSVVSNANLNIDTFETDQGPIYVTGVVPVNGSGISSGWNAVSSTNGDILGGSRELQVIKTRGNVGQDISVNVSNSTLNYSVDSLARGIGIMRWDGAADSQAGFGLNANLSNETTFNLLVGFSDAGYQFRLTLFTSDNKWSTFESTADSVGDIGSGATWGSPKDFAFPLSLFLEPFGTPGVSSRYVECGPAGCVDLAHVGAIQATIDPYGQRTALDVSLDQVHLVDAPSSVLLGLVGLGSIGMMLRRKK